MGQQSADPSHQLFGYFNAFSSPFWQKTRVELVAPKVFGLCGTLGHPNTALWTTTTIAQNSAMDGCMDQTCN